MPFLVLPVAVLREVQWWPLAVRQSDLFWPWRLVSCLVSFKGGFGLSFCWRPSLDQTQNEAPFSGGLARGFCYLSFSDGWTLRWWAVFGSFAWRISPNIYITRSVKRNGEFGGRHDNWYKIIYGADHKVLSSSLQYSTQRSRWQNALIASPVV